MSRMFYYRHGGKTHGPVSVRELQEMARDGRLDKADRVKADDKDKPYVAGTVKAEEDDYRRIDLRTPRSTRSHASTWNSLQRTSVGPG